MDSKSIIVAAAAGLVGAAAAVFALRPSNNKSKDDDARAIAALQQAELDSKIRAAVQAQASAIIPTSTAKVYPPVSKPVKQVRGASEFNASTPPFVSLNQADSCVDLRGDIRESCSSDPSRPHAKIAFNFVSLITVLLSLTCRSAF